MLRYFSALSVLMLFFAFLSGANALPQLTPGCHIAIVPPDPNSYPGALDAGVLFSQDCSTVYVMPPKAGAIDLSAVAPAANITQCPAVFDANDSVNLAEAAKKLAQQKALKAVENGDQAEYLKYANIAKNADAMAAQLAASLEKYSLVEGATTAVLLKLQYNELVSAYQAKNGTNVNFQRLPIKAGFLSFKSQILDPLNLVAVQKSRAATLEVTIAGIQDKSLKDFNVVTPDGQETIIFGDSAGGAIRLSLNGACPFYDPDQHRLVPRDFTNPQTDMRGYIAATYSYFYPIQTKGSYKITFDTDAVGDMVKKLVEEHNGDVSASVMAEDLMDIRTTQAFKIELTQDLNNSLPNEATLNDRFQAALATSFVADLLSKLGTITKQEDIPDINVNFTGFRDQVQTARHCSRGGFLNLSNSCSDYVYTIKVPAEQIKERVKAVCVDLHARYSMEGTQVNTVVFSGTTGFTIRVQQ